MTYLQEIKHREELKVELERLDNSLTINELMTNEALKKVEDLKLIRQNLQKKHLKVAVELTKLRNADRELDAIIDEQEIPRKLWDKLVEEQI